MHLKHAFVGTAIQIILCALRCVFFWFWQLHLNLLLAAAVLDDHNTTLAFWLLLVHNFLLLLLVVSGFGCRSIVNPLPSKLAMRTSAGI